jgi:hypothetical protein
MKKKKPSIPAGSVRKTFVLNSDVAEWIDKKSTEDNRSESNFVATILLREMGNDNA